MLFSAVGGTIINGLAADLALKTSRFGNEGSANRVPVKMSMELRTRFCFRPFGGWLRPGQAPHEAAEERTSCNNHQNGDQQFKDGTKKHERAERGRCILSTLAYYQSNPLFF